MPTRRAWLLLLLAFVLRLLTLGWDAGLVNTPHPDERQVGFVSERVDGWFDDPEFYAYGSLHFQAVRSFSVVFGGEESNRSLVMAGRVLSLAAVLFSICIGWWMARQAWGSRTANLFLLLVAFVPLDIQQSHFATVEAHHAAWVILALVGCYAVGVRASRGAAMLAGFAIGASLAVKVASLGLVLPLVAALVMATRSRHWIRALELAAVAATTAILALWLAQPWAFAGARMPLALLSIAVAIVLLSRFAQGRRGWARNVTVALALVLAAAAGFSIVTSLEPQSDGTALTRLLGPHLNPAYLAGVGEQVSMVMGVADLAYVRVYHGTMPFLYSARELLRWGVGPLLLVSVVGVCGGLWWVLRRWRRWLKGRWAPSSILLAVMIAWLVPMTARLGTVFVKYLRYWEPLVVPATLVAAWALLRLPRRWRRPATVLTVGATVLWGITYIWAFASPHPHRVAADWLDTMIEPDHVVAFEHWDETLPLQMGRRVQLPSYDLPDDDEKVRRWCDALAEADWVVLTSNRVRRTVLVNPNRLARTGRLYRLLLAGEAGFELVSRSARAPRLFGVERPVQLADESFVNYDFPQVVVLRRVEEVDSRTLAERTARPLPYLEQLNAAALDRQFVEPAARIRPLPTATSQLLDMLVWLAVFALLAAGAWALLLPVVRGWPDTGVGLSIVTGWLGSAWLLWYGSELGVVVVGPATATGVMLAVAVAGGVAAWRRRRVIVRLWTQRRRSMLLVSSVFLVVWLVFVTIRASNPAIFWGEKPMDFTFLNAFLRADAWPTGEPWMAGMPLHYYYFGEVLAAFPILIAGTDPAVGYNLMSATIPALGAVVLASLGLAMVRRRRWAAATLLPIVVLLTGNLGWLLPSNLDLARQGRWFDQWWATSRVIPGFAIDEYPLWTALFADLHGHFIALPVLLAALVWGWLAVRSERRWLAAAMLCGVCTAVLVATNPWDVFVLTAALGVGTLASAPRRVAGLLRLVVAAMATCVAGMPFILELVTGIGAGAGGRLFHLTRADFAPSWAVVVHFAPFVLPLAALALAMVWTAGTWLFVLPVAAAAVVLGLLMDSTAAALALGLTVVFAAVTLRTRDSVNRLMWGLCALAMVAVAACERFTLIDRMNTLFKIYNGVWVLLAVALAVMVLRHTGWKWRLLVAVWFPLQLLAMVNLPLGIAQGWLQPRTVHSPRPTLDGQAYLAGQDPQTWFLVRGLQGMARPGDVVAESARIAYSDYTRIAMHTGQTTVVGWPHHLQQRGQSRAEIDSRYDDLAALYGGADSLGRRELLDRYRVDWVVLADLERTTYGLTQEDPFVGVPGLVRVAGRDGAVIYRVRPHAAAQSVVTVSKRRGLPESVSALGAVPVDTTTVIRSLDMDEDGGTVVTLGGSVVEFDTMGRVRGEIDDLPCPAVSAVRHQRHTWIGCSDGVVWRRTDERWHRAGAVEGAAHLTDGDDVWAWGEHGLWRHRGGERWSRLVEQPLVAAAAKGPTVAVSDGDRVAILTGAGRRPVHEPVGAVRWLAWQGPVLWAITSDGLYRSGGGVLPWRLSLPGVEGVSAVAGSGERLWLVLDNGLLVQHVSARCQPPWREPADGGDLAQPRDVAASNQGWFAVADTLNHKVRWYTGGGVCLDAFGQEGAMPGEFREPSGLALRPDGTLAVADTWNGRLQLLPPGGELQVVGERLYGPRDLMWAPDGGLLVADTGNRLLLRYHPANWQRQEVFRFQEPVVGLAWVDNLVLAATPVAGQVVVLDPSDWTEVRRIEIPGWASGEQQEAYLATLPTGAVLASAPEPGELWSIDPTGVTPPRLAADGLPGVTGIAVLPNGEILASLTWEGKLTRVRINE